jgi:hypothetical protein
MSKAEVFIIESLTFEDEEAHCEGQIIAEILRLSGKECAYYYIRTKRELESVLDIFEDSEYRYLHISCHGNKDSLTTTLDPLPFPEFGNMVKPYLKHRRLFISACSSVNDYFASSIMPGSGCYSILGPQKDIRLSDAAILWASFYHVMFAADSEAMRHAVIRTKAQELANIYRVPLTLVNHKQSHAKGYTLRTVSPQKESGMKGAPPPRRRPLKGSSN